MFRRLNRRVVLTDPGKAYLAEIGAAFDRIALATSHHLARGRTSLLQVSATATLTLRWLIPRLSSFQLSNPSIEVRLTTSNDPIDSLDAPFHMVIRRGSEEVAGYLIVWSLQEYRIRFAARNCWLAFRLIACETLRSIRCFIPHRDRAFGRIG
jgi:LysR family glycine cleavage system transcriptional activator